MSFRATVAAALAALAASAAPAAATDAVCTLDLPVHLDGAGQITQSGAGTVRCAGRIAGTSVDPLVASATISGTARAGATGCAPTLAGGTLALVPMRLTGFEPDKRFTFDANWAARGPLLSGSGSAFGVPQSFSGSIRFLPSSHGCASTTYADGYIHAELVLGASAKRTRRPAKRATRRS